MASFKLDPDEFWEDERVEGLPFEAVGLLWWLARRAWKRGPLDPDLTLCRAAVLPFCPNFDALVPLVRAALDEFEGGLSLQWIEDERQQYLRRLKNDAVRKDTMRRMRGLRKRPHRVRADSEESLPESGGSPRVSDLTGSDLIGPDRTGSERSERAGGTPPPAAPSFPSQLDTSRFREVWAQWLAYRKAGKHSTRPETMTRQLAHLAPFGEAHALACVEESIRNGWTGLFPARTRPGGPQGLPAQSSGRATLLGGVGMSDDRGTINVDAEVIR